MHKSSVVLIAVCCSLAFLARAQDAATNVPKTEIENFELQTGTVIVRGYGEIGSVTTGAGVISVRCKESANAMTGRKEYGIAVVFEPDPSHEQFLIVDYDEMDSLLRGLDFLGKITYDVTTLPAFNATFTTRSGLQITAQSGRRQGGIQTFLEFGDAPRILLTSDQFAQFENVIAQTKTSLDALRNKNSIP
jgi:hypothetical protein